MNQVQICNIALQRIGVTRQIESIDELTEQAESCKLFFDMTVEMVFEDGQLNNMLTYETLALLAENPSDEWLYAYRYPNDCLSLHRIVMPYQPQDEPDYFDNEQSRLHQLQSEFDRGLFNGENAIFSNLEDAKIAYLKRPDTSSSFEPNISSLIAWRLAMEIAAPLAIEFGRADRAAQYYERELRKAMANVHNEQYYREPTPEFHKARDGF